MYHGIALDLEFEDPKYPERFRVFAKRKSTVNPWVLYGIEVEDNNLDKAIEEIQENMKVNKPYYAHFYNDKELVVVFRDKVFRVKPHRSTWGPIINYGTTLKIPAEQLDFWPNRFQDESHYFDKKDLM